MRFIDGLNLLYKLSDTHHCIDVHYDRLRALWRTKPTAVWDDALAPISTHHVTASQPIRGGDRCWRETVTIIGTNSKSGESKLKML